MRNQIFAVCGTLGSTLGASPDLSTPEGRREAGRVYAQTQGAGAAAAACVATGVGAAAAAVCGTVGANVAGRLYDYGERYGEQKGEDAYNWASDQVSAGWSSASNWASGAGSDVAEFFGFGGSGKAQQPTQHFFNATDVGRLIHDLPPVPELLAAAPQFRAGPTIASLPANASWSKIMSSELGDDVERMMRQIMGDWNAHSEEQAQQLRDEALRLRARATSSFSPELMTASAMEKFATDLERNRFNIEDVLHGVEKEATSLHPYNFDVPWMRAGTARNALASYALLQMIAADATKKAEQKAGVNSNIFLLDLFKSEPGKPSYPGNSKSRLEEQSAPSSSKAGPWLVALLGLAGVAGAAYWYKKKR